MKRTILILMIITMCVCLAGCSLPFKEEKKVETKKKEAKVEEQVIAPYIGYAPLEAKTEKILKTVGQSFPEGSNFDVLKYEAGENNKAIIRIESLEKGQWEIKQEQNLVLTHNVKNGYMIFNGDKENGISINTDTIKKENKELRNFVRFSPIKYATSEMFERPTDSEGRMDLNEKKCIMLCYEREPIHVINGNIVPSTKGDLADINDVYIDKNGIRSKAGQGLTAITVEFTFDELIPKMPYFTRVGGKIKYAAGLYNEAEITLEKFTKDDEGRIKWEVVGKPQAFPLMRNGELAVNGKNGKTTVILGGKKAEFVVPKEGNNSKITFEADGITEQYMSAKKGLVLRMFENSSGMRQEANGENTLSTDLRQTVIERGVTPDNVYQNENGNYSELADSNDFKVYAVVLNVK